MDPIRYRGFRHLTAQFVAVVLLLPLTAAAEFKVLFIGNSFTIGSGGGGVPGIFDALAQAGGQENPTTVMRAVGGMDYEFHSLDAETQAAINSQPWTHVILQNYSTEPTHLVDGSHSIADHLNYGTSLYRQILTNHSATKVILFETWSRAAAHPLITGVSSPSGFASTAEFQAELRTNYLRLARELNAAYPGNAPVTVAPVGDAWQNAGGLWPASDPRFVDLHTTDDYHGNNNGYYLAAAVFYSQIYGASPHGLSTNPAVQGLNLGLTVPASELEDVAWATVSSANTAQAQSFLFDFGAAATTTEYGPASDDPVNHWNNVTVDIGTSATGQLQDLVSVDNTPTGIDLLVLTRFNGANLNGTTASPLFPSDATSDSLFGNTEVFNGLSNIFPAFKLTGLNPAFVYNFTFFASRTGVADNRETTYSVSGSNAGFATLNAVNNQANTAVVAGIRPDPVGEIGISLAPAANNNNANHFTYLGVMRMDTIPPQQPIVFTQQPVSQTVSVGQPVTFTAAVQGTPPYFIRWLSNGAPVQDATQFSYTIPAATLAMDGSTFSISVSNLAFNASSTNAMLRVVSDTDPPVLLSASTSDGMTIRVLFSEALSPSAAVTPGNYLVNNGTASLAGVALAPDGRSVVLTLVTPVVGNYTVAASRVRDLAGNEISPGAAVSGQVPDLNTKSLLLDFGASGSASTTEHGPAPDDPANYWNNVTDVGTSSTAQLLNLVATDNTPTEVDLVMVRRFNGANTSGTTAVAPFPADATRDSLFGNTETFGGLENIFPSFRLASLNPGLFYDFTFYASRTGVSDNRETGYTVTGAGTNVAALNAANNVTNVARVTGVSPNAAGEIGISLAPTANNNNGNHFTYLGVLRVDWSLPPRLTEPAFDGINYSFRLTGSTGRSYRIEASSDLVEWADLGAVTLAQPSVLVSRSQSGPWRFFRAALVP